MNQTIDHLHLKGTNPIRSAHWYVNAFAAQVIKDDCVLPDESRGLLLEIGGLRFVVSGQPPGTTLTLRDQSSLGFYSGGLRYGLDHFAITVNKPLEQELALLKCESPSRQKLKRMKRLRRRIKIGVGIPCLI